MLKKAHIPYILACNLQIDADPDLAYHSDADLDPTFQFDEDPCGSGSATLYIVHCVQVPVSSCGQ